MTPPASVYLGHDPLLVRLKIGFSNNPPVRLRALSTAFCLLQAEPCADRQEAFAVEQRLHSIYAEYRIRTAGPTPTEWFQDAPEIRDTFAESARLAVARHRLHPKPLRPVVPEPTAEQVAKAKWGGALLRRVVAGTYRPDRFGGS